MNYLDLVGHLWPSVLVEFFDGLLKLDIWSLIRLPALSVGSSTAVTAPFFAMGVGGL